MKNVADIYALSPMQKLMLLHAKTAGSGHDVLFNQIVYRINGPLNSGAYRRAWQLMVDRHAVLRTLFVWQDGKEPLQVVRETAALPWEEHDWQGLKPAAQDQALEQLLAADRAAGFDVLQPPLMRLTLIRRAEQAFWLVWSSHHLVIDRWCIGILFNEIKTAYQAFQVQAQPLLPPGPHYRGYIAWLAERDEEAARAFWQGSLRDLQARPLPLREAPANAGPNLARAAVTLDGEPSAALRRVAAQHNLTLSTLVSGAWALVLAAAAGAADVLFGLTVSGRPPELPAMTRAVGCFINNVPLRVTVDGAAPLNRWLAALQDQQLSLQAFEYASQAQIQAWSGVKSRAPLFETLLVFQAPVAMEEPPGLAVEFARGGMQTGYPVTLGVVPGEESLRLVLTTDRVRVPPALSEALLDGLQRALLAMPEAMPAAVAGLLAGLPESDIAETDAGGRDLAPAVLGSYVPPRSAAEQALAQIWTEVLDLPRVSVEDHFFALGGDSVRALQLLARIDERLGQSLPITLLLKDPSVAEMAEAMGAADGMDVDPVLLPVNTNGNRPPFFFAHGVFGDVSSLTNIVPLLPADQPLYGLQAIGLYPGYEPAQTMEEMAAHAVTAMRRVQAAGPYYLGGFCFGGVLAYEIACQLEALGERMALLAIIEGSTPRACHQQQPLWAPQRLQIMRHSVPQFLRGNKEFGGWQLRERVQRRLQPRHDQENGGNGRDLSDVEFDNIADYNASRPAAQHKLRAINVQAVEQFQPRPFNGRVTLFRAKYLPIGRTLLRPLDPQRGWGTLARGGVDVRFVDGTHIGILRQPYAKELARALTDALENAASS